MNQLHAGHSLQSRSERLEFGKSLRARTKRESHAAFNVDPQRDPLPILFAQDVSRVADLVPIRHQRMAVSTFTFLRGAAAVMAADLVTAPMAGIGVQACGDCHLMNFGAFDTPEGNVTFDINDFDETMPGVDFTVDLKRLAASVAVAALDSGLNDSAARSIARDTVGAYRRFMRELARLSPLAAWRSLVGLDAFVDALPDSKLRHKLIRTMRVALTDLDQDSNADRVLENDKGTLRIRDNPPLVYHFDKLTDAKQRIDADTAFSAYLRTVPPELLPLMNRYTLSDMAFKVVGVGSVGTFCAIGLFVTGDQEPLLLQIKEAQTSVLQPLSSGLPPSNQGHRAVAGQQIMQTAHDGFLGWTKDVDSGRQFYIRHLKNRWLGALGGVIESKALGAYAQMCGRTLARAHVRSADAAMIAGYLGKSEVIDDAIASFAMAYAAQSTLDHGRLVAWMKA